MIRSTLAACATAAALTLAAAVPAASAPAEPRPHCVTGTFAENSGNGPTYRGVHFCDALAAGVNRLTVDGGPLKSGATVFGSHAPAAAAASTPPCWGHNGVQLGKLIGFECLAQPSGDGGGFYWSANESDINGDKHPGSGLLWVETATLYPTPDANPVNAYQDYWVGIAHQGGTFCTLVGPGYDEHPTMCEFTVLLADAPSRASCSAVVALPGQPKVCVTVRVMSPRRQGSYDQYAKAVRDSGGIPHCAISYHVTDPADQARCDIDS